MGKEQAVRTDGCAEHDSEGIVVLHEGLLRGEWGLMVRGEEGACINASSHSCAPHGSDGQKQVGYAQVFVSLWG